MAGLKLVISSGASELGRSASIKLLAELRSVGDVGPARGERRTVAVQSETTNRIDDLRPGHWQIQLLTPFGATLTDDFDLVQNEVGVVRFDLRKIDKGVGPDQDPVEYGPDVVLRRRGSVGHDRRLYGPAYTFNRPAFRRVEIDPQYETSAATTWTLLARLLTGRLKNHWPTAFPTARVNVDRERGGRRWRFDAEAIVDWNPGRHLLAVEMGKTFIFQSLPIPWTPYGDSPVGIVVEMEGQTLKTRVEIADASSGGVVAYLGSGALGNGAKLVEHDASLDFVEMLRGKMQSPLRACAAGYVLVGATNLNEVAPWHPWIANLANWFEEVPDGMILKARLGLMTARTKKDMIVVADDTRIALARGLPHYTIGIAWLRELMTYFPDDDGIRACRAPVEAVASHLDITSPFVRVNLGLRL